MTALVMAGAASCGLVNWHAIDWHQAHRNVRRLQARIVKACQKDGGQAASGNGRLKGLSCL
jgi:hypothetical protein